jgi:plastocyanin
MTSRMLRGLVGAAAAVAMVGGWAPSAQAGGGCHRPATEGEGDRVEIVKACFTPSILRTDPGSEVTFVSHDPITHNVTANGWGYFDDLYQGQSFTARFNEPGIYPFACTYHPGMVGAILVGHSVGPGSGATVDSSPVREAPERAVPQAPSQPGSAGLGWLAAGAAGLVAGAGLTLLLRRRSI